MKPTKQYVVLTEDGESVRGHGGLALNAPEIAVEN